SGRHSPLQSCAMCVHRPAAALWPRPLTLFHGAHLMRQPGTLLPFLIASCGLCLALAAPAARAERAEAEMARFMQAAGYAARDVDAAEARLHAHFAHRQPGAMTPGADVTPVEKALLLMDLLEPPLPRTRTVVRYGL